MDLQNTFYTIGIIFMVVYILLLAAVVILLFYIKNKISDIYDDVENRVESVKKVVEHPKKTAATLGAAVAATAFDQVQKKTRSRKHKKK